MSEQLLQYALLMAKHGFPVLPVAGRTKQAKVLWSEASTDPIKINSWFGGEKPNPVGGFLMNTRPLAVIDMDVKNDGKGIDSFYGMVERLGLELPPTLAVQTPSGGRHLYFMMPENLGRNSIIRWKGDGGLEDVDFLCGERLCILPGSVNMGQQYQVIDRNKIAPLPAALFDLAKKAVAEKQQATASEFTYTPDSVDNVIASATWLVKEAPESIEGSAGDNTALTVAMRLKDLGISQSGIYHLMKEFWNEAKATPPWPDRDLMRFAVSAYKSGQNAPGCATPEAILGNDEEYDAAWLADAVLPEIQWVVPGILPEGLSILAGPPKVGKSFLVLQLCLAVSMGSSVLGADVDPGEVWYFALEDGKQRLKKRMEKMLNGKRPSSALRFRNRFPSLDKDGLAALEKLIEAKRPRMLVIDTWQKLRPAQFGRVNAYAQDYAELGGLKSLADRYRIAIVIIHHFKKTFGDVSDVVERINGSSGIAGSADTILILRKDRESEEADLIMTGRDIQDRVMNLIRREDLGWDYAGVEDHPEQLKPRTETQQKIYDVLSEATEPVTPGFIVSKTGLALGAVKMQISRWAQTGHVFSVVRGKYSLSRIEQSAPEVFG